MKTQPNILEYCYIIIRQVFFRSLVLLIYFIVNMYSRTLLYRNSLYRKTCYYGQALTFFVIHSKILLVIPDICLIRTELEILKKRDANHWEKGDHSGPRFDLCTVDGHIHQQISRRKKLYTCKIN